RRDPPQHGERRHLGFDDGALHQRSSLSRIHAIGWQERPAHSLHPEAGLAEGGRRVHAAVQCGPDRRPADRGAPRRNRRRSLGGGVARSESRTQIVAQTLVSAASALLPTLGFDAAAQLGTGVETSLDAAGRSACATAAPSYFPMQKVLKMRFRMSSAVVAPVMASKGLSAPYRSSSSISWGVRDRTASQDFSRYRAASRSNCSWRRLVMKPVSRATTAD